MNDARSAPTSLYDKPIDGVYEEWHESMQKYGDSTLTLHPVAERRETFEIPVIGLLGVDWILRGTLLKWIDHYFAKPNNPDERTLGKYENIQG